MEKDKKKWREKLTPEQYDICFLKGTEPPFTGKYYKHKEPGTYTCVACHNPLFSSDTKFESNTGWPSFWDPIYQANIKKKLMKCMVFLAPR